MILLQNLINNYLFLKYDFIGITINIQGVAYFFFNVIMALGILTFFYLFGKKLRQLFFKENKKLNFFISIALGYIGIGTGIGILGAFSLLQIKIIAIYLIIILFISAYPLPSLNFKTINYYLVVKNIRRFFSMDKNFIASGIILFILISFLRLALPEISEDAYHTDLPRLYLQSHTTMHQTRDPLHVIPYPQLAEMIYIIPIFLQDKESARFIHFGLYLLIIYLLFTVAKNRESSFAKFAPLFFVTAPVVIRYSSSYYVDFFMVFAILLSVVLIKKNAQRKDMLLSGILFGASLSTKMWILVYMPAILFYIGILNKSLKIKNLLNLLIIFSVSAFTIASLWYIRAYVITGNPIYPIFAQSSSSYYFGLNWKMFTYPNMVVLSPLFFMGVIFSIINYGKVLKKIRRFSLSVFFFVITLEQLVVKVDLGRYLLVWYLLAITIFSAGVEFAFQRSKIAKYSFLSLYFLISFYYLPNTLMLLPYGLGWADKNKYLTRVLYKDNASYYDFDHQFNKWISKTDLVGTYGIVSYYYADFQYIDVSYIFDSKNKSFRLLRNKGVSKILIKGGDLNWFCVRLQLKDCSTASTKLLASYPNDIKKFNLYSIEH